MAVTTESDAVQARVLLGLNHLHAGWEFEAGRCFAAALQADPNCLLAHWGMAMSLISPSPETTRARQAVLQRMVHLVRQDSGTALEQGYALALISFINEGPTAGAKAFQQLASRFPNDPQAAIFAALFSRGGYDESGNPTPDQLAAEAILQPWVTNHPTLPVPLHALLFIRAEGSTPQNCLPQAESLCSLAPNYPPYTHLLAHYQWRSGNLQQAAATFQQAASLYSGWMQRQQFSTADCPEWFKASAYHVMALHCQGKSTEALEAARSLTTKSPPATRMHSPGNRYFQWEILTLPALLMLDQPLGTFSARDASASLPTPDATRAMRKSSLACMWIDGIRIAIEIRKQLDDGQRDLAEQTIQALADHGEMMAQTRSQAALNGELSHWARALRSLEALTAAYRGRCAQLTHSRTAATWFSAAADRQRPEPLAMPPALPSPMANQLGQELLRIGKSAEAAAAFERASKLYPNHYITRTLQSGSQPTPSGQPAVPTPAIR